MKLAEVLQKTQGTVTVRQAANILGLPPTRAAQLLARWATQGWLSRVRRGLYVPVPLEARSANVALEDPWIIAHQLFEPCYIAGWSAAEHWELTEQIFRSLLVVTLRKPRDRRPVIRGSSFVVKTVSSKTMFGTKAIWRVRVKVEVSDPTKTVLDMCADPKLGGGIRPTMDVLRAYFDSRHKDMDLLVAYSERLSNGAAIKRLGFLVERLFPQEHQLIAFCRNRLTKGYVQLDPSQPATRLVTAWRLWVPDKWLGDLS